MVQKAQGGIQLRHGWEARVPRIREHHLFGVHHHGLRYTAVAALGLLLEIGEFDLIISFANPMASEDWTTTTVTLKGCIFTEDCLESQQDDTNITHEFDLNPFDIQIGSGDTI